MNEINQSVESAGVTFGKGFKIKKKNKNNTRQTCPDEKSQKTNKLVGEMILG